MLSLQQYGNKKLKGVRWWISVMLKELKRRGERIEWSYTIILMPCTKKFKIWVKRALKKKIMGTIAPEWKAK